MDDFYKYIYKVNDGYQIKKDGSTYGWYDDIRWALHDRDMLISCDWDLGEFVYIEEPNKYLDMVLPPRRMGYRQYVYYNDGRFRIQKRVNGILKQFGTYKTLDEALIKRNELIENGWCDE